MWNPQIQRADYVLLEKLHTVICLHQLYPSIYYLANNTARDYCVGYLLFARHSSAHFVYVTSLNSSISYILHIRNLTSKTINNLSVITVKKVTELSFCLRLLFSKDILFFAIIYVFVCVCI
jgi:hypothetical protein